VRYFASILVVLMAAPLPAAGSHVTWRRVKGDFILTARLRAPGDATEWVVRSGEAAARAALEVRAGADVIQIERSGSTLTASSARFGEPLETARTVTLELGEEVEVGLASRSKEPFRDVRLTIPAKRDFVPYRDYIGSNLEVLDVATGDRTVVHTVSDSLQAPNWTPDGKALIYNRNGRLYRFDLASRTVAEIDTGFATSNNNDHVLSFDGKMLGISHHSRDDEGRSIVYVLPATGGTPKRVTSKGPSYLHGWSPDGKYLIYTGERNGALDIYKISVEGGDEVRLTDAKGVDDGSEYSSDGKYIYFNSTRTGLMQIWRMRPDGSGQEQVTSDDRNNWFPHISPDGKWIVFLSYSQEVAPEDHPFYKKVTIRIMPVSGGPAKVLAYVYGGQGTINVPSWSPDGTKVAFVSNTVVP
jgi:TolB protein